MQRGLQIVNILLSLLAIIIVSYLVMEYARNTIGGLGYGWVITSISLGLVVGIVIYSMIRLLSESRQRVLATMALNNLQRRKRNTALVVVGLLVGSAIITSSLVVGDSLDATLQAEYAEALDETDILINGIDNLGMPVWWNQTRAEQMVDTLYNEADIDAVSIGIKMSIGVKSEVHRTVDARAHLIAMDADYQQQGSWNPFGGDGGLHYSGIKEGSAYLSQKGADRMDLVVGDTVEISWTELSLSSGINPIGKLIVPTKASGSVDGGDVAVYTNLQQAQEILNRQGEVNRITISAKGGVLDAQDAEKRVMPIINSTLDEAIIGEDVGLEVTAVPEDFSVGVQRVVGEGLLSGDEVSSLRENISAISPDAMVAELLMSPILLVSHEEVNLSGLISSEITSIDSDGVADWYATPAGQSVSDGAALSLYSGGVRLSVLDKDIPSRDITMPEGSGELVDLAVSEDDIGYALRVGDTGVELLFGDAYSEGAIVWDSATLNLTSFSEVIEDGILALEDDELYLRLEGAFTSSTCVIDVEEINSEFNSCNWNIDPPSSRSISNHGGLVWDKYGQDLQLSLLLECYILWFGGCATCYKFR